MKMIQMKKMRTIMFFRYPYRYIQVLRRGRWAVKKGYKPERYPPMTSGHMYVLSRKAVSLTAQSYFSNMIPDLWIEDAYLTGVLRESNNKYWICFYWKKYHYSIFYCFRLCIFDLYFFYFSPWNWYNRYSRIFWLIPDKSRFPGSKID